MARKLKKFRLNENPRSTDYTKKLNEIIDAVNKANNISLTVQGARGSVISNPRGHALNVVIPKQTLGKGGGGGDDVGGKTVRRATCTEDAPSGNEITCNLFDSDGIEITTGVEGEDYNIPIWCLISNGRIAKVAHATPGSVDPGDTFRLTVALDAGGEDYVEYTATNTSPNTVSSNLVTLWNAEVGAEFARVTAQYLGVYLRLTADVPGEDFDITGSSVGGTLDVVTITDNSAFGNLNTATPLLTDGDDMFVTKSNYYIDCAEEECEDPSIGFETQTKWVCVSNFAATENCDCDT